MTSLETRKQAIEDLETAGREVTPEAVVEAARNPNHPLHSEFEWDVNKAAHTTWIAKAREIIRSVKIVVVYEETKYIQSVYVKNPAIPHNEQGYVSVAALRESKENSFAHMEARIWGLENAIHAVKGVAVALGFPETVDELLRQSLILRKAAGLVAKKAG